MKKTNIVRMTVLAAALSAGAGYTQAQEVNAWDLAPVGVESIAPATDTAMGAAPMTVPSATTREEVVAEFKEARAEGLLDSGEVGANDQVLAAREAYNERERAEAEQQAEQQAAAAAAAQQAAASPEPAQPTGNMDGSSSADAAAAVDTSPMAAPTRVAQPTAEEAVEPAAPAAAAPSEAPAPAAAP